MKTDSGITRYASKQDYLARKPMTAKGPQAQSAAPAEKITSENKSVEESSSKVDISKEASSLSKDIVKTVQKVPVASLANSISDIKAKKASEKKEEPTIIRKPGIFFISGWKMLGLSSDNTSMKAMAENIPGAKHFDWDQKDEILAEIKKRPADQPVVLVGHSLGGDTAVKVANELNNIRNGFRKIDLLVTLDSVGGNSEIIPQNVARNLNFLEDKSLFFSGSPNIARNTDLTDVINELRPEGHTDMDDSPDVQFKIFDSINEVLGDAALKKNFKKLATVELLEAHDL